MPKQEELTATTESRSLTFIDMDKQTNINNWLKWQVEEHRWHVDNVLKNADMYKLSPEAKAAFQNLYHTITQGQDHIKQLENQ